MKFKFPAVVVTIALTLAWTSLLFPASPRVSGHQSTQQPTNRQLDRNPSQQPSRASEHRTALVIGNGAYTNAPPLKNPPNDARDMAATLRALGFEVTSGINVNQRELKRLIREFGQKLKTGGSGLFYYAGHGVQSKGRNYLIPVEADIKSEADVEDGAVDVNLVLNYMDDAQNGLNIVILDACRNNPFARSFRSASSGLAQVDAPTGTLIAYATAPGRVASDGTARNGLYTAELLRQMRETGLGIEGVFKRVRANVQRQTNGQQVPWESSSLVGDFYFAASGLDASKSTAGNSSKPGEEVVNRTALDPAAIELSYWETIKSSTNPEDFKSYLEKYPSGQFASLAKNRISSLEGASKPNEPKSALDSSPTELAFWDSIKNSPDPEDFKSYLDKYPNGQFVALARNNLRRLETGKTENKSATNTNSAPVNVGPPKTPPKPGAVVKNQMGIEMVYIPPGEFMMGSENREKDERPVHRVTISQAFYIGRYEVTQAQWQAAMGDNPSHFKNCGGNCPLEDVSWDDAQNFINKLNESNDGFRYRLPTEAEWEYACRAGTTGDYAGDLDSMAWYGNNSGNGYIDAESILKNDQENYKKRIVDNGNRTHQVGTKQANGFGLYDMHGNVWEWCEDWYHASYDGAPNDGSAWLSGGEQKYRVLRGGSWGSNASFLRSASRYLSTPGYRYYYDGYGFRVVAVVRTQ